MEQTAYLVGQFLKVSDELHAMYCRVVRDDDIPPQLAGNSVFTIASETPIKALAQLSIRMGPYISWAKQYRTKGIKHNEDDPQLKANKYKESWRAGWYLSLYGKISTDLGHSLSDEVVFKDLEKAQLFIGYLAKFPEREADVEGETP
jgi:hypothetical protein